MQDNVMGRPSVLKQINLLMIRKAILEKGTATRAEIAAATNIGASTVRTLLTELQNAGEDAGAAICRFLDALCDKTEVRSVGIGVPGIVKGIGCQRKNSQGALVGEVIQSRYGVPVVLENDLNAISLGFGRRCLNSFPKERCEGVNLAYIHFEHDCLSAGFLSNGKVLRGWTNFAGELGLFPMENNHPLDDVLASPIDNAAYAKLAARLIAGICCVLNPEYAALPSARTLCR